MKRFRILRQAPKPQMPVEAMNLCEDIQTLELMLKLVLTISPDSIDEAEARRDSEAELRLIGNKLRKWKQFAANRMRKEFLAL